MYLITSHYMRMLIKDVTLEYACHVLIYAIMMLILRSAALQVHLLSPSSPYIIPPPNFVTITAYDLSHLHKTCVHFITQDTLPVIRTAARALLLSAVPGSNLGEYSRKAATAVIITTTTTFTVSLPPLPPSPPSPTSSSPLGVADGGKR